jgi:uncharacterized protein (DUF1330 family)
LVRGYGRGGGRVNQPPREFITSGIIDGDTAVVATWRRCNRRQVMTRNVNKPGRGYIYVEMRIRDPEGFRQYTALSGPAVRAAGGRYIVRGATPEVLEGSWDTPRIAIVEFDTREHARAFYDSAAYQTARAKRLSAAEFRMALLEGPPDVVLA